MINELAMEIKTLTEVGSIFNGNSINAKVKKEKYLNLEEGIPYIATKDVSYLSVLDYNNGVKIPFVEKSNFKIAAKNTILICAEGGSAGRKIGFTNQEVCFGNKLFAFTPKNGIDSKYVYYFYFSDMFQKAFKSQMTGIIGGVSMNKFKQLEIPIPSSPQQKQIVSILDKAFAAIDTSKANAEQNLQNAKELFESYLQNVFENKGDDWEEKTLGEIAIVKSGGTPSRARKEFWDGNIAWYSSGELNNTYTTKPERHINQLAIDNSTAKRFKKGSLLIGMYDTAALKMSILDREGTFNQAISGVLPNENIDLQFILNSINSIKPEILSLRRGVRQKNLNLTKIKNIPIYLPPIKEQEKIVQKLDVLALETKKLEAIYAQKIADLEEMKKSVLQKAFSGQLNTIN
jgi:type I restriction enzyme S subunit